MWLVVVAAVLVLAEVVASQDPTCGHCRCSVQHQLSLTGTKFTCPVLLVNCSDDRYFPGRLRVPKLSAEEAALPVWAEFCRNRYTHVGNDFLLKAATWLSLADNEIFNVSSRAFSRFQSLQSLSLARNRLDTVDVEMFYSLRRLEELDLSYNRLSHISDGTFLELSSLTTLNLSSNNLQRIGPNFFKGLVKLRTVDLSFSSVVGISPEAFTSLPQLEHLNLAGNLISDIRREHFENSKSLKSLDLSRNVISKLDSDTWENHGSLLRLILSGNSLTTVINLPTSVTHLDLTDNHIRGIQYIWKVLDDLEELLVANTSIVSLDGDFNFKNLQVINVSGNFLESFHVGSLPVLKILDLSWNNLSLVPEGVTAIKVPSLRELYLDGNPIEELVFPPSELSFADLHVVSLSGDPVLQAVPGELFAEVTSNLTLLRLSHNPLLASVHERAFTGVHISEVDLTWNALSNVPESLLMWTQLQSVNLQHNPWNCECSMQWLVDVVVSRLYLTHQNLLYELRCASPAPLRDRRMVHFYNWTQKAFCMQFEQLRMKPLDGVDSDETATLGSSTTAIIVVLSLLVALIVMIVVGVLLQRRIAARRSVRNRRF